MISAWMALAASAAGARAYASLRSGHRCRIRRRSTQREYHLFAAPTAALKTARAIEGPWASVTPRPRVRSGVRRSKPFRCQDSTRSVAARCEGLFCLA